MAPAALSFLQMLYLLLFFAAQATAKNIWHVSIFNGPALPPGKGAPIQASALRDPSYLPKQIVGIVAAYISSVVIIGAALLIVGRRLRRAAQASPKTLSMEMMQPTKASSPKAFDPSPISHGVTPSSATDMKNMWPSPVKGMRGSGGWGSIKKGHKKNQASESVASVVTFDESVIEDDKAKNEREMERLYAAVMEDDERRSKSQVNLTHQQQPQHPPELQHLRDTPQPSFQPSAPSRTDTRSPGRSLTKSPRTASRPTPLSLHSRNSSRSSFGSRHGVRGLPISPPMGSSGLAPDYDDGYAETEPLSPRFYPDPGPPPPTPDEHRAARFKKEKMDSTRLSPRETRFPMTSLRKGGSKNPSVPPSPGVQTIHEVASRPELLTRNSDRSFSSKAPRKQPPTLSLRTPAVGSSCQKQNSHQTASLPLRNAHPTNYNADRPEPSPAIKNTTLERRLPGHKNQPLRTPGTGVPMTPYSPYMPYTPLTPMTPSRLVTREERRRREKEEGRRVPTIEDAVEEEADMWGDAYP